MHIAHKTQLNQFSVTYSCLYAILVYRKPQLFTCKNVHDFPGRAGLTHEEMKVCHIYELHEKSSRIINTMLKKVKKRTLEKESNSGFSTYSGIVRN